jgi:hypothetical protein
MAFAEFLSAWETCMLSKSQWIHASHVAIATCYTVQNQETVLERMKKGIIRYNEAVGIVNSDTSGYHETLTRFWVDVLVKFVRRNGFTDPWKAACAAVAEFGANREFHRAYYSFDVVRSIEARRIWIPPDLAPEGKVSNVALVRSE